MEVLAPHGTINMMVYAKRGRQPLINLAEAIAVLLPDELPLAAKIPLMWDLNRLLPDGELKKMLLSLSPKDQNKRKNCHFQGTTCFSIDGLERQGRKAVGH